MENNFTADYDEVIAIYQYCSVFYGEKYLDSFHRRHSNQFFSSFFSPWHGNSSGSYYSETVTMAENDVKTTGLT